MFPNYFHFREEKADIAIFSCDSGICIANSKQSRIIFQPDFLGLICCLAQTLEDPEEPEESSASSHIKPVWFLDSAIGSHTATPRRESTPGFYSFLDTQKCNRHKQLLATLHGCSLSATLPCNKPHLFINISYTKLPLIWLC